MTCDEPTPNKPKTQRRFVCGNCNSKVFETNNGEKIKYCNNHKKFHQLAAFEDGQGTSCKDGSAKSRESWNNTNKRKRNEMNEIIVKLFKN